MRDIPPTSQPHYRLFGLLVGVYVVLALAYSLITPPFEAPDESYHFGMVQVIARTGQLPIQDPAHADTPWFQEGSQPPLYYLLAAPLLSLVPGAKDVYTPDRNPHAEIGIGLARINQNVYLPGRPAPVSTAVHLVRLFSILCGVVTLVGTFHAARRFFPDRETLALLAAGFVALNPMFLFINASISNDVLVTALSVSVMSLLPLRPSLRVTLSVSILAALASLTKLSGLTLYGVLLAVLVIQAVKRESKPAVLLRSGLIYAAGFVVIAGWWYLRNLQLYGDWSGTSTMIAIIGPRLQPYTLHTFLSEMGGLRISSWALFGWLNVIGPTWFLHTMDLLLIVAVIGGVVFVLQHLRRRDWQPVQKLGLPALQFLIVFVSLVNWTRVTPGTQGRLLFPAIGSVAVLMGVGWLYWLDLIRWRRWTLPKLIVPLLPMLSAAIITPFMIIEPAYQPPVSVEQIPGDATPLVAQFGPVSMVGIKVARTPVAPGGTLSVTLYYQGAPDPANLSLYITVYDCQGHVIGKVDSYPGGGKLPTSQWKADTIYEDIYPIRLAHMFQTPCQPLIETGWYDYKTGVYLKRTDGQLSLTVRDGILINPAAPEIPSPDIQQVAAFGKRAKLYGYTLDRADLLPGETVQLDLFWERLAPIEDNYTVFVHLRSADREISTTGDAPPGGGDYPTAFWVPDVRYQDRHLVAIPTDTPPGTYQLMIGLYRPADGTRMPVDTGGDYALLTTSIEVN